MKSVELSTLVRLSYDHVGRYGRDGARIYFAVVELDGMARMWRKRAMDLGWTDLPESVAEQPTSE